MFPTNLRTAAGMDRIFFLLVINKSEERSRVDFRRDVHYAEVH